MESKKTLAQLKPLHFMTKMRDGNYSNKDIDVSINKSVTTRNGEKTTRISFVFRNGCDELITKTEYVVCAFEKNRVFFAEAKQSTGYKVVSNKTCEQNKYMSMRSFEGFEKYIGDYELKYDPFYELFYVENEEA